MKKQGFTLIELLAVIVILALIALIAIPIIVNIIEKTEKNAFLNSAYGIISAAKLEYAKETLDNNIEEKIYVFPQEGEEKLNFSGSEPKGGVIKINQNGKISIAIHNGIWCAMKTEKQEQVTIKEYEEEKCNLEEIINTPVITLKGDKNIIIGLGETYIEPGFTVSTIGGTELDNSTVTIEGTIDNQKIGNYTLTYKTTYQGKEIKEIRIITVLDLNGPILNFSSDGTDGWTKAMNVTVTATDTSDIQTFTYEIVKDGVSTGIQNGTITENSATAQIELNNDGIYIIKLNSKNEHGTETNLTSKEFYIDVTSPTAPTQMNFVYYDFSVYNEDTWTDKTVYAAKDSNTPSPEGATDTTSGIEKYQISIDNETWEDYNYKPEGIYIMNTSGTHKRYFRAVDKAGNVSESMSRVANIDMVEPTIKINTGSITLPNNSNIYQATYGLSGGTINCINETRNQTNITTYSSINTLGPNKITCTVTNGTGKTKTVSETINLSYQIPINKIAYKDGATETEGTITVPPGAIQYGPYMHANTGCYHVLYYGENLNSYPSGYKTYSDEGKTKYTIETLNYLSSDSNYFVNIPSNTAERGLEVVFNNQGTKTVKITKIIINYYGTSCP